MSTVPRYTATAAIQFDEARDVELALTLIIDQAERMGAARRGMSGLSPLGRACALLDTIVDAIRGSTITDRLDPSKTIAIDAEDFRLIETVPLAPSPPRPPDISPTDRCTAGHAWSPLIGKCIAVGCGEPIAPVPMDYAIDDYPDGDVPDAIEVIALGMVAGEWWRVRMVRGGAGNPTRTILESISPRSRERKLVWAYCGNVPGELSIGDGVTLASLVLDHKAGRGPFIP